MVAPSNPAPTGNQSPLPPPPTPAPPTAASLDPFDPANLRLSQNYQAMGGVQKHVTTVPVRKPTKEEFIRVRPEPEYMLDTLALELKESRETYLIAPHLHGELAAESTVSPRRFLTAINRQGVLFLWPLKLPAADGRQDKWSDTKSG